MDTASINSCADSMMRRRYRLSATAPAHKDKNTIGRAVDDWTSAISWGESVSDAIIQEAPTVCITAPRFEIRLAVHIARKRGMRIGDGVSTMPVSGPLSDISRRFPSDVAQPLFPHSSSYPLVLLIKQPRCSPNGPSYATPLSREPERRPPGCGAGQAPR